MEIKLTNGNNIAKIKKKWKAMERRDYDDIIRDERKKKRIRIFL